jgi:hypothetical protein
LSSPYRPGKAIVAFQHSILKLNLSIALPSLQQFDHPDVQSAVHTLIASEMRSFSPGDYLSYLPYPELSFANSTALQVKLFSFALKATGLHMSELLHLLSSLG